MHHYKVLFNPIKAGLLLGGDELGGYRMICVWAMEGQNFQNSTLPNR